MALVWMDDWQFECCGEPFAVGDRVEWLLLPIQDREWFADALGPELAEELDLHEEHHGGEPEGHPRTTGTVTSIRAAFCRSGPRAGGDPGTHYPIPGTGRVESLRRADRGVIPPCDPLGEQFVGFLVDLDVWA